ncbi:hypothetical protein ACQP2F_24525 [Actinoplanes sp. CA-030573]|uniref:hypothetical protein n=1 Tax=Actinoplanes sp. CA-030573 TaxID=3239898 RepID=UPI003D948422
MTLRVVTALVAILAGAAAPVALTSPAAASAKDPATVCTITDKRMTELSGLAATGDGYVVVNDGSDIAADRKIFFLDRRCAVTRAVSYPSRPRDTEDLGLGRDGTVWVGDIGDNERDRETIGLWRLAPGGGKPVLYRLAYPDGAHDAEALLITAAGTPVIVTKGVAEGNVYVPGAALEAGRTTPLRRAGAVTLPITSTPNPFSIAGHLLITGGAVSPDGRRAVLRTYADAFEFDVTDDDIVGAITRGRPRAIPLPDEPQGESVSYTADGTALLTVSDGRKPGILRYFLPAGSASAPPPALSSPSASASGASTSAPSASGASPSAPSASAARTNSAATRLAGLPFGAILTGLALILMALVIGLVMAVRRR